MSYHKFKSTYLNKLNITIKKNITDDVFHILLDDGRETINQVYFNKKDCQKIIKALKELLKDC